MQLKRGLWFNTKDSYVLLCLERYMGSCTWEVRVINLVSGYSSIGNMHITQIGMWEPLGETLSEEFMQQARRRSGFDL